MNLKKNGNHISMELHPKLSELLTMLFAIRPTLEYSSTKHRPAPFDTKVICEVEVYESTQKLGRVGWINAYTRNGYEDSFRIVSPKIHKERGDKNTKQTGNLKTAFKLCKELFVKDDLGVLASKISSAVKQAAHHVMWTAQRRHQDMLNPFSWEALKYMLASAEGNNPSLSNKFLQEVKSEKFIQARDNYRICISVHDPMNNSKGAIVYVDRQEKISFIELETNAMQQFESVYDMPKNYQEKFAMLKIMELDQPVETVGMKMQVAIDDAKETYYYLCPGDVLITH